MITQCIVSITIFLIVTLRGGECNSVTNLCPYYKIGSKVDIHEFVGTWITVYEHTKAIDCFQFDIRATTELERERYNSTYGNFSGRVDWNYCYLQVLAGSGQKHFLMGNGTNSGLLENIIIVEDREGKHSLQNRAADQWLIFGRRGNEVLLIRDCVGESAAAFARAPYWPTAHDMSAIFHRSGIAVQTYGRSFCDPSSKHGFSSARSHFQKPKH